jgi:hypothetical protein
LTLRIAEVGAFDHFLIYRSNCTASAALLAQATSTVYVDKTVKAGVGYCFKVLAVDKAGQQSLYSNTVSVTVTPTVKGKRKASREVPPWSRWLKLQQTVDCYWLLRIWRNRASREVPLLPLTRNRGGLPDGTMIAVLNGIRKVERIEGWVSLVGHRIRLKHRDDDGHIFPVGQIITGSGKAA